ncbi:phospholipase A2 inhibitor and Ly6/PLAUR domain-containing protein-like [Emys orbicularis]|uniref:phospholipase A2 inhibitor and Ly6/PLAUR domain-containing protein-like n=1 Tax=Emys orbicularis TaxID=82168 RepID=UPI0031FBC96C
MVSFILCLLPALLATSAQGQTLTCNTCFGQTETCKFAPGTCQDNNVTGGCLSVAEAITLDGTQNTNFYKQCLSSYTSDIKVPISFTVGNGKYVRINIKQCNNADKCNSPVLGVPTGSTTENGLQCPTCFALNFALCNSSVTPCTGDETYCIDFTGFLYQGPSFSPFEAKGCASASAQAVKPGTNLTSTPYTFYFFWGKTVQAEKIPTSPPPTTTTPANTTNPPPTTATPANTTLPTQTTRSGSSPAVGTFSFALYLPGLTGLLLVKLLS